MSANKSPSSCTEEGMPPAKVTGTGTMPSDSTRKAPRTKHNYLRDAVWGGFALLLIVAPQVFSSGLALSMLSQMGYLIIICLSYNILLGQGGMLSFGHAVYVGLGAFIAIHVLNRVGAGDWYWPVSLLPLVGGLAGAFFAALLGYVTTRKAGTTFAMITLGIGELVAAISLMLPEFFGGEGGISTDRVVGDAVWGISFGPSLQVYYLIAAYCFVCTALMYAFTQTPLGRMLNAARDNPERVEFIGYNTQRVRYLSFIVAGFFAGIGGGLMVLHFEIITAVDSLNAARSGGYLLFTFLGGATVFFGPMIGGVLMVLTMILLSELTQAWMLYLGLIFLFMVMFAPGGIASLVVANLRLIQNRRFAPLLIPYGKLLVSSTFALAAIAIVIEMIYHLQMNAITGPQLEFLGLQLNVSAVSHWLFAVLAALLTCGVWVWVQRGFMQVWHAQEALLEVDSQQVGKGAA